MRLRWTGLGETMQDDRTPKVYVPQWKQFRDKPRRRGYTVWKRNRAGGEGLRTGGEWQKNVNVKNQISP